MPKGFHERMLVEEPQVLMEKLAKSNPVVIQMIPWQRAELKLVMKKSIDEENNYGCNLDLED